MSPRAKAILRKIGNTIWRIVKWIAKVIWRGIKWLFRLLFVAIGVSFLKTNDSLMGFLIPRNRKL
jgi:hypothetical protein